MQLSRGFTLIAACALVAACSHSDVQSTDTSRVALAPAPSNPPGSATSSPPPAVRGTLTTVTDTALVVNTATGPVTVKVTPPLHVFDRAPSDLSHVTSNAFVGVTSVKQPDGSERATEIHIFPEELRGTGEGSRMMDQAQTSATANRMTNGTVSAARMTNGTIGASTGGRTITVSYAGGTQAIAIPAGVTVTAITQTKKPLAVGQSVAVLTKSGAAGGLTTSTVLLAAKPTPGK
jgi:hypothetical protein